MRVEQLSSYGEEQLNVSRRAAQKTASVGDLAEIDRLEAEAKLRNAHCSKPLLRLATNEERGAQLQLAAATQHEEAVQVAQAKAGIRAHQREVGERGEQRLYEAMKRRLGDEWIMFRGYMTKRGEADVVLIGPRGVWVVEVKTRRVRLHVDGGNWYFEKLSRAGWPYETRRAVDGGGRVWGKQAADAAAALGICLHRSSCGTRVRTAVVLMAGGAEIAECRNSGVDLVTVGPAELEKVIRRNPLSVDLLQRREIEDLVRQDHEDSMKLRRSRQGPRSR